MKKHKLLLLTLFFLVTNFVKAQDKIFKLNITGKQYDKMVMVGDKLQINGESDNGYNWSFIIPEYIYETNDSFSFRYKSFDDSTKTSYQPLFCYIVDNDTIRVSYSNFGNHSMEINAQYINTFLSNGFPTKGGDGVVFMQKISTDRLLISHEPYTDLKLRMQYPRFGYFSGSKNENASYQDYLDEYNSLAKENPDSRYLMTSLSSRLNHFQSKDDVKRLFECFSKESQESYFGEKVNAYLTSYQFDNIKLPLASDTTKLEKVIVDSNKYHLLLFSASWCGPCHAQLPILRKIYKDLDSKLELVYLSTDEERTIVNWTRFIKKEEVPWRSLLLYKNPEIWDKYNLRGIPHTLLVAPDGKAIELNLRKDGDLKKLYQIITEL